MGLTERLNRAALAYLRPRRSSAYPYSMDDYLSWITTPGAMFPLYGSSRGTLAQPNEEPPDGTYESLVTQAYKANGVVFAVEMSRLMLFKEPRFAFQRLRDGEPGELFGNPELAILERPWEGGTTGALLGRMIVDADFGGTAIVVRRGDELDTLPPDRTVIVGVGNHGHRVLGVAYFEDGIHKGGDPEMFLRPDVAIFAPVPDPVSRFRGMPWLVPIISDVLADKALVQHKVNYFRNGATVNQVVTFDPGITPDQFDGWVDKFEKAHANRYGQAFKTLYLGGGVKFQAIGSTPQEIDLKAIQGAIETRIAAAGMVPPIVVGLSEGLASATYSNYGMARRKYADATLRPLWRDAAEALQTIIPTPSDARLWYNDKDIPFLQEDAADAANILNTQSTAINTFVTAGFEPESAVRAVNAGNLLLLRHSGYVSVQLQPAGKNDDARDQIATLIEQVKAGLITENEARATLGLPPMQWSDELSLEEIASIIERVKAGLMTENEARELMKLGPMQWSDDIGPDESSMLIEQVKAGLLTEDEARALMGRPPMQWSTDLGMDDVNVLAAQVKEGLLTIDEARALLGRPAVEWPEDLGEKVEQAGALIRAGFDPADVLVHLGLPPMRHLGLPPVTVQKALDAEGVPPDEPEPPTPVDPDGKRAVERARQQLIERGIARPTQAQLAEHLGVSDRTVRRWEREAA